MDRPFGQGNGEEGGGEARARVATSVSAELILSLPVLSAFALPKLIRRDVREGLELGPDESADDAHFGHGRVGLRGVGWRSKGGTEARASQLRSKPRLALAGNIRQTHAGDFGKGGSGRAEEGHLGE